MSSSSPDRVLALAALWGRDRDQRVAESAVPSGDRERDKGEQATPAAPLTSMTDEEALTRLKEQDRHALELLFERYARLVMTIAFRVLRDRGEAEDLMQSVFLYLFEKADRYDQEKGTAAAWITRRAYFHALNRRNFLTNRRFYLGTDFDLEVESLAGECDLEEEVEARRNREQILLALKDLPERQRLTLEWSFFEGLSLREIAERLGETLENTRHHYYRGLNKLRQTAAIRDLKDGRSSRVASDEGSGARREDQGQHDAE